MHTPSLKYQNEELLENTLLIGASSRWPPPIMQSPDFEDNQSQPHLLQADRPSELYKRSRHPKSMCVVWLRWTSYLVKHDDPKRTKKARFVDIDHTQHYFRAGLCHHLTRPLLLLRKKTTVRITQIGKLEYCQNAWCLDAAAAKVHVPGFLRPTCL